MKQVLIPCLFFVFGLFGAPVASFLSTGFFGAQVATNERLGDKNKIQNVWKTLFHLS